MASQPTSARAWAAARPLPGAFSSASLSVALSHTYATMADREGGLGCQEHVLPGVAAQDDVVQATGEMKTGFASHVTNNITNGEQYAIYQA